MPRQLSEQEQYMKFLEESVSVSKYRPGNMWNAVRDYDGGKLATSSDENAAEVNAIKKKVSKTTQDEEIFDSGATEITEDEDVDSDDAEEEEDDDDEELPGDDAEAEDEASEESQEMADAAEDTDDCPGCGEKIEEIYKQLGVSPIDLLEEDEELAEDVELTQHENQVLEMLIREMDEVDGENSAEEDEFLDDVTSDEEAVEDIETDIDDEDVSMDDGEEDVEIEDEDLLDDTELPE